MIKYLLILLLVSTSALADKNEYNPAPLPVPVILPAPNVVNNYTDVINQYVQNSSCNGAALASAIGNNQMYLGTHKPQISFGAGSCGGEYAGSVMFGAKPCDSCPMINGSIAKDRNSTTFGVGMTVILK